MNNYLPLLQTTTLFAGLSAAELSTLLSRLGASVRSYGKGEALVLAGEPSRRVGIVLSGELEAYRPAPGGVRIPIARVEPGGVFGDVLGGSSLSSPVTVLAAAPCEVLLLPYERLLLSDGSPAHQRVVQNLVRTISDKYFSLSHRIDLLVMKSLRAKVAAYLLSEAARAHSLTFSIPFSRIQLADYLNCDRSALSRELSTMQREGLIDTYRSSFKLLEPDALQQMVLVDGEKITAIVEDTAPCEGYEKVDLKGGYLMPGLINLHVHLAGNGKPSAKPRDNAALVRRILSNGLTRAVAYRLVCSYAKLELLGGVTTIRTVGGLADFDTRCRDDAAKGKILAPRILAANEGISVPGGHMAGSVAVAAHNNAEALAQLRRAGEQGVDLVKLMITGGVLDATQKGTPGELKMKPEMVRAVCDEAHRLGYPVAAHTESPEGVKVALENGVDSIEHGAKMDEETIRLYKKRSAFVCTTISPALPYALFDPAISGASEKDQYNGRIVFDGVVESARTALANGIPVGLGNDVGCPYVTQYDFWRELCYFHKYCGVSNQFALYTATLRNARLAGVGDVTGSIEAGKSADFIVTRKNPLDDLTALRQLELVVCRGRAVHKPAPKRNKTVDALLDPYLA